MITAPSSTSSSASHPWSTDHLFQSPGCHFTYRVIGPCCRLFDREQLPWPCCRLQWRGKEPSWRRIGRRFVVDMATRRYPSYSVEIVGQAEAADCVVMTVYTQPLSAEMRNWWYARRVTEETLSQTHPPHAVDVEARQLFLLE